uniref:Uncharacterized protein n=1 Tax=Oryza barthii TaxID=65489 RepID=A0A0D3GVH7_9ORYZ
MEQHSMTVQSMRKLRLKWEVRSQVDPGQMGGKKAIRKKPTFQSTAWKKPRKESRAGRNPERRSEETRPKSSATTSACSFSASRTSPTARPTISAADADDAASPISPASPRKTRERGE